MKIKTYSCAYANAHYSAGKFSIHFTDRCISRMGSVYTSLNEEEQDAIEKLADFGGVIRLESCTEVKCGEVETRGETAEAGKDRGLRACPDITSVQDAITEIKRVCAERGLEYSTIRSREETLKKAGELGISFPNMK